MKVAQLCLTLCDPMDCIVHGILQARILSLLQGMFPTQGLNPGLQHCRQILYQLSHKGMSSKGKFINTESKSMAAWGWDQNQTYRLAQANLEGVVKCIQ